MDYKKNKIDIDIGSLESETDKPILNDIDDFNDLYEQYKNLVYTISKRYLSNNQAAEDNVQDVFINLLNRLPVEFTSKNQEKAYIAKITINCSLLKLRSKKYKDVPSFAVDPMDSKNYPDVEVAKNEIISVIFEFLLKYDRKKQELFIYYYYDGTTLKELANTFGYTLSKVYRIIRKITSELADHLEKKKITLE